jgi:hypothetical protein
MEFEQLLNEALKESPLPILPSKLIETGLLNNMPLTKWNGSEISDWYLELQLWRAIR